MKRRKSKKTVVQIKLEAHSVAGEYFLSFRETKRKTTVLWLTESELRQLRILIQAENL